MLAAHKAMSEGWRAVLYFIALFAFAVAAFFAWVVQPRLVWAALIAVGLAAVALVSFWNALALS